MASETPVEPPVEPVAAPAPVAPEPTPVAPVTPPVAPVADATQYTEMVSSKDQRVFRVPANRVKAYTDYGFVPTSKNGLDEQQVHAHFGDWKNAGTEFLVSTVGNAPFVRTAVGKYGSKGQAQWLANQLDDYKKDHPFLDFAAGVTGTAAEVAGATALAAVALPAGAAAAVGTALGGAASTIRGAMVGGAISNAALGSVARFDDAALHHAYEPAGQEKISWSLMDEAPNMLKDAVLGGVGAGVIGGFGKLVTKAAGMISSSAQKTLRAAVLKDAGVIQAQKQGRGGELLNAVDEVLAQAPGNHAGHIKAQLLKYGNQMGTIKTTLGERTALDPKDAEDLIAEIRSIAGSHDVLTSRLEKEFFTNIGADGKPGLQPWTLDHVQKVNDKIYEHITWSDYDVNRSMNDKYLTVAQRVCDAGRKILEDNDQSMGGTLASEWNEALNNYSRWSLLKGAFKNAGKNTSIGDVMRAVAANTVGGAFLGTMLTGNPVVGLGGAAAGIGYGVLKSVKPVHYAQAMQNLEGVFTAAGTKMTRAAMSGLYGVPAQLHSRHYVDHDKLNATLAMVAADPQRAHANLRTHYAQAGVPDAQADDATNRQFAALSEIASQMPQRQAGADLPSRTTPDAMQQRKINGMYQTLINPAHAIANPTKENLAFVKKHYPHTFFTAQQAVLEQLQKNPDLPYAVKAHAARILGRPVSNSTSPKFAQMIQQARQQMEEAEQQGAQSGSAAQKSVSSGDSSGSGTRLDELQGGGG